MKNKIILSFLFIISFSPLHVLVANNNISLTLIPPSVISNKVNLDVRAGIVNDADVEKKLEVRFFIDAENTASLLYETTVAVNANSSQCVKFIMSTADKAGDHKIILVVKEKDQKILVEKPIKIIDSKIRSLQQIDGAWVGLYHWSETEGKMWNPDIKKMTEGQWRELVQAMHKIQMDIIVVQESFRNEMYVDKHHIEQDGYDGKAYYPSGLYLNRMPIASKDPIEAILSEADKLGMNVFIAVGLYAWFDFTPASLEWHKKIASELWKRYGQHPSFYGWYISEENSGGLDAYSKNDEELERRQKDIVNFLKGFKAYCSTITPDKPVMLATSSYDVPKGEKIYPELLKYLDILCPFGFARMPEGDLTGEEAAKRLQTLCDNSQMHLWFDLEAFLFHQEGYLYPRPIDEIVHDMTLFDNFEKILCYQYPGVFNNPDMSIRIGEESTIKLYIDYQNYLKNKKISK